MADEEAEQDLRPVDSVRKTIEELRGRLEDLEKVVVRESSYASFQSSSEYCEEFCKALLEFAGRWRPDEEPRPLVEVYLVALLSYAKASPYLFLQCESVTLVLERLSLSFLELLLTLKEIPNDLWKKFQSSVQFAHSKLQEIGITQLSLLSCLGQYEGVWTNQVLQSLLSNGNPQTEHVEDFLAQEGPVLLQMRVKQLMKETKMEKAALLAKACSESLAFKENGSFKQMYLVCLCRTSEKDQLMEELSKEDCREALEMICNLDSEGEDSAAFSLCSAFLTRQLLHGDTYCAWELTLFWSKLLKRLEPSNKAFLDGCRQMSLVSKSVCHILFLIKVIQSEIDQDGLPVCIELCIRALRIKSEDEKAKSSVCKTISCLLSTDLEVKRACQLTEFLLEPTVDAYYAVETVYNEPDQKLEEENMPIPNSLRCELLLVLKNQWPFDPEFWDWKTLKRQCLALMGEEASIVSSIDSLNDSENTEEEEESSNILGHLDSGTYELESVMDSKQNISEVKRERGFVPARVRSWQIYMQYCVLCDKEFLGHRIVRHAQTHLNNGVYSCPICAQTFNSKDTLIPHVTSHVKQSCKERLTAIKTNKKLVNVNTATPPGSFLKPKKENKMYKEKSFQKNKAVIQKGLSQAGRCDNYINEYNICPVAKCKRSFKFVKNLIAHVRGHGDNEEAKTFLELQSNKIVCQFCRRHFISVNHLNDHLQTHCGAKPYKCIQLNCQASFLSNAELLSHKKTHTDFKARCMFPKCGKVFYAAFQLYDHEAHHYKTFTCKIVDCGKVFHSQQQLELHLENHSIQEEEEKTQTPPLPGTSLSEPHPPSAGSKEEEPSQENLNTVSPGQATSMKATPVHPQETLKTTDGRQCKPEPMMPNSQMFDLNKSVIKSVHTHLLEGNKNGDEFDRLPLDCTTAQKICPTLPLNTKKANLCGQSHISPSNGNTESTSYNSKLLLKQGPFSCRNILAVSLSRIPTDSAMPKPNIPNVSPQQLNGTNQENGVMTSNNTGPIPGQTKERFHCVLGTCKKHYSCYRSVTKHMKAVHPEFYEKWKTARTDIKVTYVPSPDHSPVDFKSSSSLQTNLPTPGVQRQNIIQPPSNKREISSKLTLPPSPKPNGLQLAANVLNQIALAHLGNEKSQVAINSQEQHNWLSNLGGGEKMCSSSQIFTSNQQVNSKVDYSSAVMQPSVPSCSLLESEVSERDHLQSQLNKLRSPSIVPYRSEGSKVMSQQMEAFPLSSMNLQSSFHPSFKTQDKAKSMETLQNSTKMSVFDSEISQSPENQKLPRKPQKGKWPAIIKDGKFACRRCFREFDNPKSLGGHLSKRTSCRPFPESEINLDMPQSFLDLLNSEAVLGMPQAQPSHNSAGVLPKAEILTSDCSHTNSYPVSDYLPKNLPTYGDDASKDDILKQIMAESNMTDLFVHHPLSQPLFHNAPTPYAVSQHLPGTSVIQHTENVQAKQEDNAFRSFHSTEPSNSRFPGNDFPDPLLSQLLTGNASPRVLGGTPSNNMSPGFRRCEGYHSKSKIQTSGTDSNSVTQTLFPNTELCQEMTTTLQMEDQRKNTEMDIKKRLRDQILAGDFQRKGTFHSGHVDNKPHLQSSLLSCSPFHYSEFQRFRQDTNSNLPSQRTAIKENALNSESSDGMEHEPDLQSFINFRETATTNQELQSPTVCCATDPDLEPLEPSDCKQPCMMEILCAFQKLDLITEKPDKSPTRLQPTCAPAEPTQRLPSTVTTQTPDKSVMLKPFACDSPNCTYSYFSGDSLWKHLSKMHNYTIEMVNAVKKRYGMYAPFKCLRCTKAFTRNSNLRVHYQSVHKFSSAEIEDLDKQRRQARAEAAICPQNRSASIKKMSVGQNSTHTPLASHTGTSLCPPSDPVSHGIFTSSAPPKVNNLRPQGNNAYSVLQQCQGDGNGSAELDSPTLAKTLASFQSDKSSIPQYQWSQQQRNSQKLKTKKVADQDTAPTNSFLPDSFNKQSGVKPKINLTKKTKTEGKKSKSDESSMYKPYRCVHQGCVAAFTIQHNLILHYRAVHQSALSALELNEEPDQGDDTNEPSEPPDYEEEPEEEFPQISEFRCQVQDCCCVFQEVPNLFQHYLQLHKFPLDKIGILLSGIRLGRFVCGHQGCQESFTAIQKYISHVKLTHKDLNFAKYDQFHASFKCEVEGCERSYATKSNMLRHLMKKHPDLYENKMQKPQVKVEEVEQKSKPLQYQITKLSNGKENIETNRKIIKKENHSKRVYRTKAKHWLKYGKPSMKSKVEAAALCTRNFPLQYPCMIKGCTSVMKAERSILKHYVGHGLSEKYLEQHRSHFIFCKKLRLQKKNPIKTDSSKLEKTPDHSDSEKDVQEMGKTEKAKIVQQRRSLTGVSVSLFDIKLSNETLISSGLLKRKRGRPRKFFGKLVKRRKILCPNKPDSVSGRKKMMMKKKNQEVKKKEEDEEEEMSTLRPAVILERTDLTPPPLASFKPMGFEMSFLKFLEQSEQNLMRSVTSKGGNQTVSNTKYTCVRFSNPQKLKSLCKVKIKLDAAFSDVTDPMLKQLQDMRPAVVLEKYK